MTKSEKRRRELRRALMEVLTAEERVKRMAALDRAHEAQVWEAAAAEWKKRCGVKLRGARR